MPAVATGAVMHPRKQPFPRSRDVDQNPITDASVWQAVGLVEPTADSAGIAIDLIGEWFEIKVAG
jgi:hypothetical protein